VREVVEMRGAWSSGIVVVAFTSAVLFAAAASFAACSAGGNEAASDAGEDAPFDLVDAAEASLPVAVDAGPLWQTCNPVTPSSCPTGFECLAAHTAPVDAYGTCVFTCAGASGPACTLSGGVCACPYPFASGGPPGDCSAGNDAGEVTVCAPAGDGGPAGTNQLEDTGAPPADADAGITDASAG
jgi:hypothetical protein